MTEAELQQRLAIADYATRQWLSLLTPGTPPMTRACPELQAFLLATAQEPWASWYPLSRLVFADWLEEQGDGRADLVRSLLPLRVIVEQFADEASRAENRHACRRRVLGLFPEVELVLRSRPAEPDLARLLTGSYPPRRSRRVEEGSTADQMGCIRGIPCRLQWVRCPEGWLLEQTIAAPDLLPPENQTARLGAD